MFKTVLVPVDISAEDIPVEHLKLARHNVDSENGKIVLLYVMPLIPGFAQTSMPSDFNDKALPDAKARLKKIAEANGLAGDTTLAVLTGKPARTILDYANEIGSDLIVIASHDPDLSDYLLGSTAARVVRHAHCSVLVARKLEG